MKILSLTLDQELSRLRETVLSAAGYEVTSLTSEKEALQVAQSADHYEVVLLCHRFPAAASRQAVRLLRQHHPDTRTVHMIHIYGEWPEVDADRYVVGADGPDALLHVLAEVHKESSG